MSTTTDNLTRANASFRRGGKTTAPVLLVLTGALVIYWLSRGFRGFVLENITQRPIGAWITIVVLLGILLWGLTEALHSSRTVLTPTGIERSQTVLQWSEIAAAEYARGWLRLTNHQGRHFTLSLMFASSSNPIVEAVQDHLPAGVRLHVY